VSAAAGFCFATCTSNSLNFAHLSACKLCMTHASDVIEEAMLTLLAAFVHNWPPIL
jgi:hypothetical protein